MAQKINTRIPNLFIIGGMKCGTSSLHNYLAAHPDIYMSEVKEPMHFSREENWSKAQHRYFQLFKGARDEKYLGESSTEYTKRPRIEGVAERIYQFNPQARLIYMVRDPFDRIVSQYKHEVVQYGLKMSLTETLKQRPRMLFLSYYAYQLRPYLEAFGNEAVFVGIAEDLASDPENFCKRLFAWLEIDQSFNPGSLGKSGQVNVSPDRYQTFGGSVLAGKILLRLRRIAVFKYILDGIYSIRPEKWLPGYYAIDFRSQAFEDEVEAARKVCMPIFSDWNREFSDLTGLKPEQWQLPDEIQKNVSSDIREATRKIRLSLGQLLSSQRPVQL